MLPPSGSRGRGAAVRRPRPAAQGDEFLDGQAQGREIGRKLPWALEGGQHDTVALFMGELGDRPHRQPEEMAARVGSKDADRLEPELLEGPVCELGRLARAVESHALEPVLRELLEGFAKGLAGAPVEVERVGHVLVGQLALFGQAPRRQEIAQALASGRPAREVDDLDIALLGEALEVEIREAEGHAQALGQVALGQGPALADGRKDLEVALDLSLHGLCVQNMNISALPKSSRKPLPSCWLSPRIASGKASNTWGSLAAGPHAGQPLRPCLRTGPRSGRRGGLWRACAR